MKLYGRLLPNLATSSFREQMHPLDNAISTETLLDFSRDFAPEQRIDEHAIRVKPTEVDRGGASTFLPDETKSFLTKNKQIKFDVEIYYRPSEKHSSVKDVLVQKISEITQQAWEDFGDVVQQWFDWAGVLLLAKVDGKVIGFNASAFEGNKTVLFLASFVLPEYQSQKVARMLKILTLKNFLQQRSKKQFFDPLWFTFRTQNPRVMHWVRRFKVAPSVDGREPSQEQVEIAKKIANRFSPNCGFDERNFVLKGALKGKPNLLEKDKVFYSNNKKLNAFCDQHLEYDKQAGNLFIAVGRFNWIQQIYIRML